MTKLSENKYHCDWCGAIIEAKVGKFTSSPNTTMPWAVKGKQNVTSQLKCPNCHRLVSQRLKIEGVRR